MSVARSLVIRPRVLLAALAGGIAALLLPSRLPSSVSTAMAGDIAAVVYLLFAFQAMLAHSADSLRKRAAKEDDGAVVILVIVLVAIALSFWTIFGVLSEAKQLSGAAKAEHTALAAATILLSWLVTQTVFTFHYAHEYYRPDESGEPMCSGLEFPKDTTPDYWDFFYFSTSFGAASQTSDVAISGKELRRIATLHAIVSFFFNTAVLALAINIGASLI
jgi:uncharacterized membrane protein